VRCDNGLVTDLYKDQWITCTEGAIVIRWYYLWGAKRIPYASIRSATQVGVTTFHGGGRIWGTANPRYWASLDPGRRRKKAALILDLGRRVCPYITPDDVGAVEAILKQRAGLTDIPDAGVGPVV
jgi:hypothetical protein